MHSRVLAANAFGRIIRTRAVALYSLVGYFEVGLLLTVKFFFFYRAVGDFRGIGSFALFLIMVPW